MQNRHRQVLIDYLARYGITAKASITEVESGFDLSRPLYERMFHEGDRLFQLIRRASFHNQSPARGSWYGLAGMNARNVAVMHGLAGRRTHEFRVIHPFTGLEGIAGPLREDWSKEIGGPGGGTQIYVPRMLAGCIEAVGPVDPW